LNSIDKVYGKTSGFTNNQLKNISRLYRRKVPASEIITQELARTLTEISNQINKVISLLIDRKGKVKVVYLGDSHEILFGQLIGRAREAKFRLRGYRLVHTHLKPSGLTQSDLSTLLNERLDMICSINVSEDGKPGSLDIAHIAPPYENVDKKWEIYSFDDIGRIDINFEEIIEEIENEMEKTFYHRGGDNKKEGVLLVGFDTRYRSVAENSLRELKALALSSGKAVLDTMIQIRKKIDPRYLIGKGKLKDVILKAKHLGAEKIIFDVELTPAQVNSINEESNLKITDRTQLILEIFAKHATSSEGKIQVKLAELKYNLPRLRGQGIELSQLGGGIGTRGPGEKKLETERRRIRKQIDDLENKIEKISKRRAHTRKRRFDSGIPTISFVGYTNVGKSTLFNSLTKDKVVVKNKLFSTLNPTTRKINLSVSGEVLVTDTVGFISKLPDELINAFRATLEELGESRLLIHVTDASDPLIDDRIESVEKILSSMEFNEIPRILVLNKIDRIDDHTAERLCSIYKAPAISAVSGENISELLELIDSKISGSKTAKSEIKYSSTG